MTYLTERLQPNALAEYACLTASKPDSGQISGGKLKHQRIVELISGLVAAWNDCQNENGRVPQEAITPEVEALLYCKARKLTIICGGQR